MTKIVFSPFKNPYLNLAIEDNLLRTIKEETLFLYVNRPCLVFGRFQNPWLESNLKWAAHHDIWPVRRQSGGGTVYHDEGNLNYSYLYPGPLKPRAYFLQEIQAMFSKRNIHIETSERNDLWLHGKKISGSAYKQTKLGSFHHGTLLVRSDLNMLEESLKSDFNFKETKSIASVRSRVTNLSDHVPDVDIFDVVNFFANHFSSKVEMEIDLHAETIKSFEKNYSSDWIWCETPYFEFKNLIVSKGIVQNHSVSFTHDKTIDLLSHEDRERFFPHFSEPHRWSNQF